MYSCLPSFILGFHGCDKKVGEKILLGEDVLKPTENDYDWLGHGSYFWENNPTRALNYAKELKKHPERCKGKVQSPFVIGSVIDLGYCFNLLDSKYIGILKESYKLLSQSCKTSNIPIPENMSSKNGGELLLRKLDCAVIEITHTYNKLSRLQGDNVHEFDSVRGLFDEGKELYPNAGFKEKNHIQVCVKNPNCIKGYFRVLSPNKKHPIP